MKTAYRTHTCNELTAKEESQTVTLSGWVNTRRDHGGIIFIDLRDRYGLSQIVFDAKIDAQAFSHAEKLRREDVITVTGTVKKRGEGLVNPKLPTGEIEVFVSKITIHNKSQTPPFEIDENKDVNEDLRLEYRYLDLRRKNMQHNLAVRHTAAMATRKSLSEMGFLEIETPLLIKPTPEGARDYIVPSRVNRGTFYSLPQSPQLYKQILMVGGCDRYFQLAKCLRDEDLRADRQPEFTQIDVEASFVGEEDIYAIGEKLVADIVSETTGQTVKLPIPRFTHSESIAKFGSDKPDIRYELFLTDVSEIVKECGFSVFKDVVASGGIVKAINPPQNFGRKELDNYITFAQQNGAKGLAWMRVTENKELDSNIAKFFDEDTKKKLVAAINPQPNSVLMFIADTKHTTNMVLDKLRRKLAVDLEYVKKDEFAFCWVTDFPLFEWDDDAQDYIAAHHMFTMPKEETLEFLETDKSKVYAQCYDLVLNGWELASGSIRIHREDIQKRVMTAMNISEEDAQQKFGFLLKAFEFGAPPHGGFAIGFDRIVALLLGYSDIREVMAFPKNKSAQCPMDGSPSPAKPEQLKELNIEVIPEKKKDGAN